MSKIPKTKPGWTSEDTEAENSLKTDFAKEQDGTSFDTILSHPDKTFSKENKVKLDLLRELNRDVINLGKSQISKIWVYDWIDKQKQKLMEE